MSAAATKKAVSRRDAGIKMFPHSCLKCGYEWTTSLESPKKCPNCKNANYDKPKQRFIGYPTGSGLIRKSGAWAQAAQEAPAAKAGAKASKQGAKKGAINKAKKSAGARAKAATKPARAKKK